MKKLKLAEIEALRTEAKLNGINGALSYPVKLDLWNSILDLALAQHEALKFYGDWEKMHKIVYECEGPAIGYVPGDDDDDFEDIKGTRYRQFGKRAREVTAMVEE
jgi:hypothetical protein